jgi:alpha-L-rhamnosidase
MIFDVSKMIKQGENTLAAMVGDGWYSGRLGMAQALGVNGKWRAVYGRTPAFAAKLVIEYADKTSQTIESDKDWIASTDGPYRSCDLLDGVVYDATKDRDWLSTHAPTGFRPVRIVYPQPKPLVVQQTNQPVRATKRLKPVTVTKQGDQKFLVDFGQNMPGWVRFKAVRSTPGKVTIQHGEMLDEKGNLYTENLRGADQIDEYTIGAEARWVEPKFTYHGFRYAEIKGIDSLDSKEIEAVVFHTDLPIASTFKCSNPMLNKLWSNIQWTIKANMMSVPTDCPQRDERLGWMGDMLAFGETACYFYDLSAFFPKWLIDIRDAQADDGRLPDFAPHPYGKNRHFTGVPGWGDAGVVVPEIVQRRYGNTAAVKDQLSSIERYLSYLEKTNPNHLWEKQRFNDYGDWLNGNTLRRDGWNSTGGEVPKEVFATLMWYQSSRLAEKLFTDKADKVRFSIMSSKIKAAFNAAYVQPDGTIKGDTQAGYALALYLGILPKSLEQASFAKLVANFDKYGGRHTTGFVSTLPLMEVLTRFGRSDIAYGLVESTEFPSWGYSIVNGSTTIWERWDGYVAGRGFQDKGMNSFNHWALGSVGQWMFERMLGMRQTAPNTVEIRPYPGGSVTHAEGSLKVNGGTVHCSWKPSRSKEKSRLGPWKARWMDGPSATSPSKRNIVVGLGTPRRNQPVDSQWICFDLCSL